MALRLIQFLAPKAYEERLDHALEDLQTIRYWQISTREDMTLLEILAEAEHTETIIHTLEKTSLGNKDFRAILLEVKATSPAVKSEEKEETQKDEEKKEKPSPERVACLELVNKLTDGVGISRNYLLTVLFSVIVVSVGLARNNMAVIIGAMVIAPFLIPNMALSLATTLGDGKLARRALKANALGMFLALLLATGVGFLFNVDASGSEIASRAEVGYSDIVLALAAGATGALAFTSGVSATLVGVMVAVALLPPIAAAGLLLGSGYLILGAKALLLTLVNIICINLSGVGMFLFQGVRPRFFWETKRAKRMLKIAATIWTTLLVFLVGVIYLSKRFPI